MRKRMATALSITALTASLAVGAAPNAFAARSYACHYASTEPVLSRGDRGAVVKQLQCELNNSILGERLAVDGTFGSGTAAKVKYFQRCEGLRADGIVGHKTWARLNHWTSSGGFGC
ncbi:peptidoglycan-binding protein [Streptomyces sp. NPDC048197]|uniref:peptidoglycan-binding domain-containing protein n=1 Tax=Streptomyces sp. NPDC048197 TaxID=3365511 RepID=UPI0037170001